MTRNAHKILSPVEVMYLKDRHVDKIIIRYSGAGDSGQIDETVYISEKNKTEGSSDDFFLEKRLDIKIESIGYDLLNGIGDWYNNSGGQGYIEIMVSDLEYNINAEYNPEEKGTYDEEKQEWIPDEDQDDPFEEYYEGYLKKQ